MLEKPDLLDETLIACLRADFAVPISDLTFLPLGADLHTAVYRAMADDGTPYFVKLRGGPFDDTTVTISRFLRDQGIEHVIAPLQTRAGRLWSRMEAFAVMLYPFIAGRDGFQRELTQRHWIDLGLALRRMHTLDVPPELLSSIPRESYSPRWRASVHAFLASADQDAFADPAAARLAGELRARRATISDIVERAARLANTLRARRRTLALCHADIHAGNVLIADDGRLYIVDWDTLAVAPKERDLMFIGGGIGGVWNRPAEAALFYQGYGATQVDWQTLAYYRLERIVEDIAVTCQALLDTDAGGDDRELMLGFFLDQFLPNNVVEIALATDASQSNTERIGT